MTTQDPYNQDELDRQALLAQMKGAGTVPSPPDQNPGTNMPKVLPDPGTPPPTTGTPPPAAAGPYQSHHGTVSGYLQAAAKDYMPTVQGAKSEQEAKSLAEAYFKSLVPEIEKRGGKVGDVKNEKINIDGKWVDLYRDIGGASEAQYLVDDGGGAPAAAGMSAMPLMMDGGSSSSVAAPVANGTSADLMKKIAELLGPDEMNRQALLAQMKQA